MVFIAYKLVLAVSVWKENAALKKKKEVGNYRLTLISLFDLQPGLNLTSIPELVNQV